MLIQCKNKNKKSQCSHFFCLRASVVCSVKFQSLKLSCLCCRPFFTFSLHRLLGQTCHFAEHTSALSSQTRKPSSMTASNCSWASHAPHCRIPGKTNVSLMIQPQVPPHTQLLQTLSVAPRNLYIHVGSSSVAMVTIGDFPTPFLKLWILPPIVSSKVVPILSDYLSPLTSPMAVLDSL